MNINPANITRKVPTFLQGFLISLGAFPVAGKGLLTAKVGDDLASLACFNRLRRVVGPNLYNTNTLINSGSSCRSGVAGSVRFYSEGIYF